MVSNVIIPLMLAGLVICLYFLPTYVAFHREKKNKVAIAVVNIFLGFTIVGWVISLAWACMKD